ncbi:MAG: hypothetical protein Q9174_006329 [Haloplaca sp. 1 TL-2023]
MNLRGFISAFFALQSFRRVLAIPVITKIPQTALAVEPTDKYDIRLCNATQEDFLARAIDLTLSRARNVWDAASTDATVYEPFFKNHDNPVLDTLSKVASYEPSPARGSNIFWACIVPDILHYLPRSHMDLYKACDNGTIIDYVIVDSFILVCPQIFDIAPEPLLPQPDDCPAVVDNRFTEIEQIPVYRSDIVFKGMVDYALPMDLGRAELITLDEMVAANAYSSYLSPWSYQTYSIMIKNNCRQVPTITNAPWDSKLIADNTTSALPPSPSSMSSPNDPAEIPVHKP